ncbi:MAG: DNA mismatch repair endonuclease MutL [Planctomycetes bacterium]|nr:DNA mismatch repair endonuclease MutL [Planctomycetota bacterium]
MLIDKIAAGEVIERPASIVKELIENSIDAGAASVEATVEDGGKKTIRVVDNGSGISPDDLPLAFLSHTTSKIADEPDLFAIRTLGFRGEALASIGAVSQSRLVSRTTQSPEAYEITISGGKISQPKPAAAPPGTTVEVENLFYNTPARRRFLKSSSVELGHITDVVTRFALSHPEIRFVLTSGKQRLVDLPSTSGEILERLTHFFGQELTDQIEVVARTGGNDDARLRAYISRPDYTWPNSKHQFYYFNRRYIRDRVISRAIAQAYLNLIPSGRYPFVLLFIEMDPANVDVNVHPTKIEVRFRDAWQLHDNILTAIRTHLIKSSSLPGVPEGQPVGEPANWPTGRPLGDPVCQPTDGPMKALVDFFATGKTEFTAEAPRTQREDSISPRPLHLPDHSAVRAGLSGDTTYLQVHNSYIIQQTPDGIMIIDQHALHERILYTKFSRQFADANIYRQRLLMPQVIELTPRQAVVIHEVLPYLKKVGLEIEEFGKNTVNIQAVPALLSRVDMKEFITEFLIDFEPDKKSDESVLYDKLLKLMACKAAVKAGDPLTGEEIQSLLSAATDSGYTLTCPHGRPAIHKLSLTEIAKYFNR